MSLNVMTSLASHINVITILRAPASEVTALLKNLRSEMKDVQEKQSIMDVSGR